MQKYVQNVKDVMVVCEGLRLAQRIVVSVLNFHNHELLPIQVEFGQAARLCVNEELVECGKVCVNENGKTSRAHGTTAAHLTPHQKIGSSNLSALTLTSAVNWLVGLVA